MTHALPDFHITSTHRACPAVHRGADGAGLYRDACCIEKSPYG